MSYRKALEAAGAEIHEFKEFGSYQGDWWAKVKFKGKSGWVRGSYGSCSGCDAFQAEFECDDNPSAAQLKRFGLQYLDDVLTQEEAVKEASEHIDWDGEAQAMVDFIKSGEG